MFEVDNLANIYHNNNKILQHNLYKNLNLYNLSMALDMDNMFPNNYKVLINQEKGNL
jgi:hypothetical protein